MSQLFKLRSWSFGNSFIFLAFINDFIIEALRLKKKILKRIYSVSGASLGNQPLATQKIPFPSKLFQTSISFWSNQMICLFWAVGGSKFTEVAPNNMEQNFFAKTFFREILENPSVISSENILNSVKQQKKSF